MRATWMYGLDTPYTVRSPWLECLLPRKKIIMVNGNAKCVSYIAIMIKDTAE